jgi:IMP dehydrogenase
MERAVGRLTSNPNLQNCYVIAGNVATPEATKRLAKAGAHCVRTSVSSGSVCSTRVVTGFGLPTLQAVIDIAEVVHSCGLPVDILADGGIRTSGDAVKCLVAGADVVMLGSYLAGTDEAPGTPTHGENGQKYKTFRGMASSIAYQNLNPDKKVTSEGISVEIPVKGPVGPILDDFMGGIRSGCSYAGVAKMVDLYQAAEFRLVTNNGHQEGLPHILNTKGVDTDSKGW